MEPDSYNYIFLALQLENYFIFNDRHRAMRMDIDDMPYEVCLLVPCIEDVVS
jgi:hypothetical protein